jgi:hypothetical protein
MENKKIKIMINIKNIYYSVWSDLILGLQNKNRLKSEKWFILFFMSFCLGLNYAPIIFLLPKSIDPFVFFREIRFFDSDFLNTLVHGLILFLLPGYIVNYFLVFYKKKYEKFTKKYEYQNLKYFMRYLTISAVIPCSLLIIFLIIKYLFY